jgi:histidinol phosphatase-like PHP family hydrolase
MYNLHCHSLLSDGVLLPSEVAMRYMVAGYRVIAITDHADYSTIESTVRGVVEFCRRWPRNFGIRVLPGVELTHLPLEQFKPLTKYCRAKGIKVVVGHGETTVEPVLKGTNRACIEAGVDILAHPGMISDEEARLAQEQKIFLELTSRRGHCNSNNHVMEQALKFGAQLILNNDSHSPEDIIKPQELIQEGLSLGLTQKEIANIDQNIAQFLQKAK